MSELLSYLLKPNFKAHRKEVALMYFVNVFQKDRSSKQASVTVYVSTFWLKLFFWQRSNAFWQVLRLEMIWPKITRKRFGNTFHCCVNTIWMQLQTIYLNGLQALCHWNHFWMLLRSLYALTPKDSLKLWTEHDLILIGKVVLCGISLTFDIWAFSFAASKVRSPNEGIWSGSWCSTAEPGAISCNIDVPFLQRKSTSLNIL